MATPPTSDAEPVSLYRVALLLLVGLAHAGGFFADATPFPRDLDWEHPALTPLPGPETQLGWVWPVPASLGRYLPAAPLRWVLHLASALLLFEFARRVLRGRVPAADGVALVVALVWGLHPTTLQVTHRLEYLGEQTFVLGLLLALLAGPASPLALVGAAVAAGSSPTALVLPAVVLLVPRPVDEPAPGRTAASVALVGLFALALWPAVVLLHQTLLDLRAEEFARAAPLYARSQFPALGLYLFQAVAPLSPCFDYSDWPVPTHLSQWGPYFALFLGLLFVLVVLLVQAPPLGRLLACFFLLLVPTSSLFPQPERVQEARLYAALVPLLALLVVVAARLLPAWRWLVAGVVIAGLFVLDLRRTADFHTAAALWERTAQQRPGNERAIVEAGRALARGGDLAAADARYQTLLESTGPASPWGFRAALEVGLLRLGAGRVAGATTALTRAELLRGDDGLVRLAVGRVRVLSGDLLRGTSPLESAAVEFRDRVTPRLWLALAYRLQGRDADADNELALIGRLDPTAEATWRLACDPRVERRFLPDAWVRAMLLVAGEPSAAALDLLAATQAGLGDHATAVETARRAEALATDETKRAAYAARRREYEAGRPFLLPE